MKSLAIIDTITTDNVGFLVSDPHCFGEALGWGIPLNMIFIWILFGIYKFKWSKITFPVLFTMVLGFALLTVVYYRLQFTQNIVMLSSFVLPSLIAFTYILFFNTETKWKYFNAKGKRKWILEQAGWNVHKAVAQMDYLILNNAHKDQIRVSKTWEFTTPLLGNLDTGSQKHIKDILHVIGNKCLREMTQDAHQDDAIIIFDGRPYSVKEMQQNITTLSPVGLDYINQYVKKIPANKK